MKLFDSEDCLFDASSTWEANRAILAGVSPHKILITAQELSEGWDELARQGCEIDVGNLSQLEDYGKLFPDSEVSVRINLGFGSGLVERLTAGGVNSSFGIWYQNLDKVIQLSEKYKLKIIRLHTHIGSGHDSNVWEKASDYLLSLLNMFEHVHTINMGGGYRVPAFQYKKYNHEDTIFSIQKKIQLISSKINRNVSLEIEPGTYLTANYGVLISKCIDVGKNGEEGRNYIKINSGLTEIARTSLYATPHPVVILPKNKKELLEKKLIEQTVFSHCCIVGDLITQDNGNYKGIGVQLLPQCNIGDYVVIKRAGGYCDSMSLRNFNSFPTSAIVAKYEDGSFQLVRRRETLVDIVKLEL